jgi:hypothetical protein
MNINELEKLAKAATPGPWIAGSDWVTADPDFNEVLLRLNGTNSSACGFDLDYIASANPQTILAMIELLREMGECLEYEVEMLGFDAACARDALQKYKEVTK